MAKYPKFLEGVNPNGDPDDLYIVHTQHPRFIAAVMITEDEQVVLDFERQFSACGRTTYKELTASIGVIEFWDEKSSGDVQKDADNIAKLMSRCGDWYYSTLKEIQENE